MEELKIFVEKMRATSSSTEKVQIIKNSSKYIHEILEYTYNPYKQYHLTSKTALKNKHLSFLGYHDLFYLLDALRNRVATGHTAIEFVNAFAEELDESHVDLFYKIIDKDLGIRAGDKIINKAVPGLIPTFNVALAQSFEGKCDWNDGWFASRKLDGVRCIGIVNHQSVCKFYTRAGKEIFTLDKVGKEIRNTGIKNVVFDGEICLVDENGNEDFQGIMKQLRRKEHQIKNPAYMIFDMLTVEEFDNGKGNTPLATRLTNLTEFLNQSNSRILKYAEQAIIKNDSDLASWNKTSTDNGWEGVMLRKNVGYEGKRTKNLLKIKKFFDAEYKVVDVDFDNHEVVRNGRSETLRMLSQVWIEHKGYRVKVGSGFSQEQRIKYMTEDIVGKTITVQYFEETKNQEGGISLRFPTVKHIYDNKRDM